MAETLSLVRQQVSDAISQWRRGRLPDARHFLQQHPEVKAAPSLVIDLAYEEFCLRQEAGERVDTEKFLNCFPTIQHSLARMLDVHEAMGSQALQIGVETEWPEVGTRWLDWDLVEPLGRGAFSRVFIAREPALGNREVVVKCSFAGPHEAFVLGSLSHPNIVPIHSSRHDEELGLTGISMPLLGRSTLADVLNRLAAEPDAAPSPDLFRQVGNASALSARQSGRSSFAAAAVDCIQRVAQGLAAAHRLGVVHGDIKPSNILLSFAGEPMLMDFNLSAGPGGDFERAGGTPPYMAPECLADFFKTPKRSDAAARTLDPRSDLFSLGVVLLELLLGRIPFRFDLGDQESFPTEVEWQKLIDRAAVDTALGPKLRAALQRCLAFDPARRYTDASELADDLAAILAAKERICRWTRRAIMLSAATIVLGTSVTVWALNREDPNSTRALLRRAKEHIEKEEYGEAATLLGIVQKQNRDTKVAAWAGYCHAESAHYQSATSYLLVAVEEWNSAELQNDLGHCFAKLREETEAELHLERALTLNPGLQAAYHNRANMHRDAATSGNGNLLVNAWRDYESAMKVGPRNGELHLDAAKTLAFARLRMQILPGHVKEQIVNALAAGIPADTFTSTRFQHVQLDLVQLQREAKSLEGPRIPREARLLLPPPFPLPTE